MTSTFTPAAPGGPEQSEPAAAGQAAAIAPPGRRKETLADVLRRRSIPTDSGDGRATGVRTSLGALTGTTRHALIDVPLDQLRPNPFQPRFHFHRQPMEELAQSLATEGQLEAVIARPVRRGADEYLELVAGARRLEAARLCHANIKPFPTLRVDVREMDDEEAERVSLIENLQRENLTPLEEGYRYWQLQQRDLQRWSVRAIADFVHKKKSTVQNRLGLVKDAAVAEAVLREHIPPTAGFHIMRLPGGERSGYLQTAVDRKLTVEQIKADIDRRMAQPAPAALPAFSDAGSTPDNATGRRGKLKRQPMLVTLQMRQERLQVLDVRRAGLQARIDALEAELREELRALRAIDQEIAELQS